MTALLSLAVSFPHGDARAQSLPHEPLPWKLKVASAPQLASALRTCLGETGATFVGGLTIGSGNWARKALPNELSNPKGVEVFASRSTPILLARIPGFKKIRGCSVLVAADAEVVDQAIALLHHGFSAGEQLTPHGSVWRAKGFLIDNDYANGHVFEPEVFEPEKFTRDYHDIRVHNCEGSC